MEKIRNTFSLPAYRGSALAGLKFFFAISDASDPEQFQPKASGQIDDFEARGGEALAMDNHALRYYKVIYLCQSTGGRIFLF